MLRIVSSRIIPYQIALEPPFRWRAGEVSERSGLLLRLVDAAGRVGWGDAAPLAGFSHETVAEAGAALDRACREIDDLAIDPAQVGRGNSEHHHRLDTLALPASARYALDLALLELAALGTGASLAGLLRAEPLTHVPVAALIDVAPERVVDEAGRRAEAGYIAVKLKAGRLDPESDAEIVRDVRRRVGSAVELRADANRAWDPDQAETFARRVAEAGLAYVEEPLAASHAADLQLLASETRLPVALDETLVEGGADAIEPWLAAVVVKPTVIGGVAAVMRMAARAAEHGVPVVLSAAFESGVGQRGVAALAAATGAHAAGLDPYSRLANDVVEPRLPLDRPLIEVDSLFGSSFRVVAPLAESPQG